ncbi:MAG: bifunctional ADP-dependent NAD(P)H-hydrate dehydratase/NAD(P)H-hydrate epimerase, partial [Gammaproteobacteria bacterium]|nr:bifunctional ADP-dependent NAD(P)H-hydrate dehydratase/NAD(P)H-hydrate epimerase [Gammaproteobacteria bacterium]
MQATAPEAIFVNLDDRDAVHAALERSAAVAAGPGLGTDPEAGEALTLVLDASAGKPTALDADALTLAG